MPLLVGDTPDEAMPSGLAMIAQDPFCRQRISVRIRVLQDIERLVKAQGEDETEFSTYLRMVLRHLAGSRELRLPDISKPELALYYLSGLEKVVNDSFVCNPLGTGGNNLLVVWDDARDYFNASENSLHPASASALFLVLNHDGWTWNAFPLYRHAENNIWYLLPLFAVVRCVQVPEEKYVMAEEICIRGVGWNIPSQLMHTVVVPLNVTLRYCLGFITLLNMGEAVLRCAMSEPAEDASGLCPPWYAELIEDRTTSLQ